MKPWAKIKIAEVVDHVLSTVILSSVCAPRTCFEKTLHSAALANLQGTDFHIVDHSIPEIEPVRNDFVLRPDDAKDGIGVSWPFDMGMAFPNTRRTDPVTQLESDAVTLTRLATIGPKDVRGCARIIPSKLLSYSSVAFVNGIAHPTVAALGMLGNQWRVIDPTSMAISSQEAVRTVADMAVGLVLEARYNWHIAVGYSDTSPRLLLPTGPKGAMAFLKHREVEPGQERRAAIKHWVSQHYRENSENEDSIVFVRQHLRGHTQFLWNGLFCELLVSEYDLERNELFRLEAAEWRSKRKHNHARLRVKNWKTA